jgi:LCP family protein required for cell wall assembly
MSQAQPLPPRNGGAPARRSRPRGNPRTTTGRTSVARERRLTTVAEGKRARSGFFGMPVGWGRLPLLAFVAGLGLGYGLAGPLPGLIGGTFAALQKGHNPLGALISPLAGLSQQRILLIGVDRVGDNTDVILTAQVKDGQTKLTQVPRDTFIETERYGVLKANALYAFGGMDAARKELGELLGAPISGYLRVNLRAVERIADALGGVEVDVPKRMYYVDNAQGLYIDLYPGVQVLKGEELEGFLRFRHDELGDLGRLERQKLVLRQVFAKLVQPTTLTRLPELLQIAGEDIDTDLSPLQMGQLLTAMATTRLSTSQVPGRLFWHNDLSFWMPDSNPHYGVNTPDYHLNGSESASGDAESESL